MYRDWIVIFDLCCILNTTVFKVKGIWLTQCYNWQKSDKVQQKQMFPASCFFHPTRLLSNIQIPFGTSPNIFSPLV